MSSGAQHDRSASGRAEDRIVALDAGRGLAVVCMILLNALEEMSTTPWWLKHVTPLSADAMTVQDYGFAAFLFLVGVSVPVSVERRLARGTRPVPLVMNMILRFTVLMFLGAVMTNSYLWSVGSRNRSRVVPEGWLPGLWDSLLWACVVLILNHSPVIPRLTRIPAWAGRALGAAGAICLIRIAQTRQAVMTPFEFPWSDVLSMIAFASVISGLISLRFRRNGLALIGAMMLLVIFYFVARHMGDLTRNDLWHNLGQAFGTYPTVAVAGLFGWRLLYSDRDRTDPWTRILSAIAFGAGLALAGQLLRPIQGISRMQATPSWALWSTAITCWLLIGIDRLAEFGGFSACLTTLRHVGRHSLLAYLLPWILMSFGALLGTPTLADLAGSNFTLGCMLSLLYTVSVVALAVALPRLGIAIG